MTKKKRNFILMLSVTFIMGALLWILIGPGESENYVDHEDNVSQSDSTDDAKAGTLINEKQDDLKSIVFSNEKAKYNVSIDKKAGEVVFSELKNLPVNHSFMEYIWYGIAQMSYQDIITTTDSEGYKAADYGFDKPSLTVIATFSRNKKYKLIAGDVVPGESEDVFYVKLDGDKNVYACSIDTAFFMGNNYFLSDDVFYYYDKDIENDSDIKIGDITLTGNKFDGKFVMKVNKESNLSNPFCGYDYVVTAPINWPVKQSSAAMLVHELTYLTADDTVVLNPSKKQLKQYGISSPSLTIEFTRNGKSCTLYVGNINKTDMYVMLKGQPIIYRLDVDALSILHKLTPEIMYGGNALSLSIDTISSISVKTSKFTKSIEITRTQKGTSDISEVDESVLYTYSVNANGKEKKYSTYTNFIKQLNNSSIQKWNVKKPNGKAAVTITIEYFDSFGRKKDVVKFYKYSNREYAVVWADYPINTVSSTWLNQMLENCSEF